MTDRDHRPLGRPPATTGEETRHRLLHAARECFAEYGFAATTNRMVADRAGLTTGAIYHYFPSKQEMYLAAYEGVQEFVYGRFADVVIREDSLLDELRALFGESARLNAADHTLSGFLMTRRTDGHLHPELLAVDQPRHSVRFFEAMAQRAVGRHELRAVDVEAFVEAMRVLITGMVFVSGENEAHMKVAIEAVLRLFDGSLVAHSAQRA